mmetsp:Transcript_27262/g.35034  ORF Transcript_27262/g.35034 Transcript_27262/m.35034 type:complete len:105 (-) Transcript_27262:84-398(-)
MMTEEHCIISNVYRAGLIFTLPTKAKATNGTIQMRKRKIQIEKVVGNARIVVNFHYPLLNPVNQDSGLFSAKLTKKHEHNSMKSGGEISKIMKRQKGRKEMQHR